MTRTVGLVHERCSKQLHGACASIWFSAVVEDDADQSLGTDQFIICRDETMVHWNRFNAYEPSHSPMPRSDETYHHIVVDKILSRNGSCTREASPTAAREKEGTDVKEAQTARGSPSSRVQS